MTPDAAAGSAAACLGGCLAADSPLDEAVSLPSHIRLRLEISRDQKN
ncbi:putative PhzF superfamily epimerase YddE/YHI9 [Bradyrhizobium sp. USDA 326]